MRGTRQRRKHCFHTAFWDRSLGNAFLNRLCHARSAPAKLYIPRFFGLTTGVSFMASQDILASTAARQMLGFGNADLQS
jgi:hypothetical protein